MMLCGGVGLLGALVWIAVDSAGSRKRRQGYTEQAAMAVHAVPNTVRLPPHTTASFPVPTVSTTRPERSGTGTSPLLGGPAPAATASTRFCAACGTPLPAGAAFCQNCGKRAR